MPNRELWNENVPRVEYDYRARNSRLQLERIERLLVKREAKRGFRHVALLVSLLGNVAGSRRRTEPPGDRHPSRVGTQE